MRHAPPWDRVLRHANKMLPSPLLSEVRSHSPEWRKPGNANGDSSPTRSNSLWLGVTGSFLVATATAPLLGTTPTVVVEYNRVKLTHGTYYICGSRVRLGFTFLTHPLEDTKKKVKSDNFPILPQGNPGTTTVCGRQGASCGSSSAAYRSKTWIGLISVLVK